MQDPAARPPALFEVTFSLCEELKCDEGLLRLPYFPCLNYAFPMKAADAPKCAVGVRLQHYPDGFVGDQLTK